MKKDLKKTKIVGTIGPASDDKLEELIDAGLNATRINYSHGSWNEQKDRTEKILKLRNIFCLKLRIILIIVNLLFYFNIKV